MSRQFHDLSLDFLSLNNVCPTIGSNTLVLRPGYTGNFPYIFSEWNELYTVLRQLDGRKHINFMFDIDQSPIVIPAGHYDLTHTDFTINFGSLIPPDINGDPRPKVILEDGVTMIGLSGIYGLIQLEYQGTTEPCITIDTNTQVYDKGFIIFFGASLYCTGSQPFFKLTGSSSYIIAINTSGSIGNGTNSIVDINGGACIVAAYGNGVTVSDNCISGDGFVIIQIISGIITKSFGTLFTFPTTQSQFTGTIAYQRPGPTTVYMTTDPTSAEDSAYYVVGDSWINTTSKDIFMCADNSSGAAIWHKLNV